MEFVGLFNRRPVSLPLFSHDMKENRFIQGLEELKRPNEKRNVMTIDRSEIPQAKIFEDHAWSNDLLNARLDLVRQFTSRFSSDPLHELCSLIVQMFVSGAGCDTIEMLGDGTGISGNRPLIVVENHDETLGGLGNIIKCLVTDATGECGITCNGHDVLASPVHVPCRRHTQGSGQGGSRMPCAVAVVLALCS